MEKYCKIFSYHFSRTILKILFNIFFRLEVHNKEVIPREGPFIMAANHLSNFDPPLLGIISPNRLYYLGKQELFCNNFVSWFLDSYGVIPLRRQASDINAIRRAIEVLKQGKPLVIFPQGSRSENYDVFFGGVGFLHRKTKVPVVLAKLEGTDKIFSKKEKKLGINSKIRVKFKKMQDFPEERNNKDIAKKIIGGIRGL